MHPRNMLGGGGIVARALIESQAGRVHRGELPGSRHRSAVLSVSSLAGMK